MKFLIRMKMMKCLILVDVFCENHIRSHVKIFNFPDFFFYCVKNEYVLYCRYIMCDTVWYQKGFEEYE